MEKQTSFPFHDEQYYQKIEQHISKNKNYYIKKWMKYKKPLSYAGWNWAACFLTPFWLSYRHMYGKALLYFSSLFLAGIITLLSPMITYFHMQIPIRPTVTLSLFFIPLIHVLFGWKGNAWYLKVLQDKLQKDTFVPLYNHRGTSLLSAILTPIILSLFFLFPTFEAIQFLNKSFVPYGIFVAEEGEGAITLIDAVRWTEPKFEKYSSSIQLIYHGREAIGREIFHVSLSFRENRADDWINVSDRSYSIFSGKQVTLNLIDGLDPLTKTGEYLVEVFVGEKRMGEKSFHIYF